MGFSTDWTEIVSSAQKTWESAFFYIPLGIVGAWRWSVWLIKVVATLLYRSPKGDHEPTVSVVTPVYNEDPVMFLRALESWKSNAPQEIVAVIDRTDKKCIDVFRKFSAGFLGAKLIVTDEPGKRPALAKGVLASQSEIVILADSDTVWTADFKKTITRPFSDYRVAGVASRQDVLEPKTLAQRLFRIHLFNRYNCEIPAQAAMGTAISCISGRTGAYRRNVLEILLPELVNETFLGKKCISGDDKRLTSLVQRDGWVVRYMDDALVYTPGFERMSSYVKQNIRWTRNSWRSDISAVLQGWIWRHPFLAFVTVDRFIQPFTLLLGPAFFVVSILRGDWVISVLLSLWWVFGRGIKTFRHIVRHPADLVILPLYAGFCFFTAVIKIFTLLTVDEQSWITRWSKDRLQKRGLLYRLAPLAATVGIVFLLFFASYESSGISNDVRDRKESLKEIARAWKTDATSGFIALSQDRALYMRQRLADKVGSEAFAYYRTQLGDTVNGVKDRYGIPRDTVVRNEDGSVLSNPDRIAVGQRLAFPVSGLRQADYATMIPPEKPGVALISMDAKEDAIRVKGDGVTLDIPALARSLGNAEFLKQDGDKEWILRKNLYIDKGVTLVIDGEDVSWLKLRSGKTGFVWLKSENGNLLIRDTKVTSWDEQAGDVDRDWSDGRSYILQKSNGRMDILKSEVAYLGYLGFPNRGNPFGGPYGISWKITSGSFRNELATGSILKSRIHHNYFGVYTYGATGLVFSDNDVYENIEYGIDPHDDSNNLLIEGNRTYRNGTHGIIASKRCFSNVIRKNHSYENGLHGIMLDRSSDNNIVEDNVVDRNVNGIALFGSSGNVVSGNRLVGNKYAIRANNASSANVLSGNTIESGEKGIFLYGGSSGNFLFENDFSDQRTSVHIKERSDTFLTERAPVFEGIQASFTGVYLDE